MRTLLGNLERQGPADFKDKDIVEKSFMIKRERMKVSKFTFNFRNFKSNHKQSWEK